ncbi:MAG TPA: hypothetical protein VFN37_06425 [Candidatus Baltobacteraceae bacterium]|nr:hypothetical protein [Candidatus Baltobacteraceae bacterium]
MKAFLAALAVLTALAALSAPARADEYAFKRTLDFTIGTAGTTALSVAGQNGNIHLMGDGGSTIRVHAVLGARSADALRALDVTQTRSGNTVRIADVCPATRRLVFWTVADCDIELDVHYPRSLAVGLRNENGNTVIDGAASALSVANGNGNIRVNGAGGPLSVKNGNGNVSATLAKNWRGSAITMHTNAGNVHLRVPRGFAATVTAKVTLGEVRNTADVRKGPATVNATTTFGNVVISQR